MAKYELSDEQAKDLITMLNNASIKVSDAPKVMHIIKALQTPVKKEAVK